MKKARANWCTLVSVDVDCPHCGRTRDIYDECDLWEIHNENQDEDSCNGMEFKCKGCGEIFGLESITGE